MSANVPYRDDQSSVERMLIASIAFLVLAFWLWRILATGEIAFSSGRHANFAVDAQSDPQQYWGTVIFFAAVALAALVGALWNAWDTFVKRPESPKRDFSGG